MLERFKVSAALPEEADGRGRRLRACTAATVPLKKVPGAGATSGGRRKGRWKRWNMNNCWNNRNTAPSQQHVNAAVKAASLAMNARVVILAGSAVRHCGTNAAHLLPQGEDARTAAFFLLEWASSHLSMPRGEGMTARSNAVGAAQTCEIKHVLPFASVLVSRVT